MSVAFATFISQVTLNELALRAYYATLVFVPVYVSCRFLRQRLPYLQLTLWSLVLIRALLPASFSLPFSVRSLIGEIQGHPAAGLGDPLRCLTTDSCSNTPGWILGSGSLLVVSLWALLSIYSIGQLLARRHRFKMQMKAALPARDPQLLRSVAQWRHRFHISRSVELRIGQEGMPFTMGWCRPRIHLPAVVAADGNWARVVIGHEMAHIKRFDDLWVLLCGLTTALYFFLPPVRFAVRRINLQRERVCDQLVISSGLVNAAEYAHRLLDTCTDTEMRHAVVPGLSAHAAIYASRFAAISEAAANGIRGIPVALCILIGALLFVMPMRPIQSVPVYSIHSAPLEEQFIRPVDSQRYAARHGEMLFGGLLDGNVHTGVDFIVPAGTPVAAIADGTVESRESRNVSGSPGVDNVLLLVRHGQYLAYYTYLDKVRVRAGDRVTRGQVLGLLHDGSPTQAHKGAHLHFEVTRDGVSLDPLQLLPAAR